MNQKPLSAAYEHMTNHQLAAAAYAHLGDELESLRIKSAVPRKTYTMLDAEFVDALVRIYTASQAWSSDYWRLQYLSTVDVVRMTYAHLKNELSNSDELLQALANSKRAIAAHVEALKEVCETRGIDYKTVLKRNQITGDVDMSMGIDQEHKTEVITALEVFLAVG